MMPIAISTCHRGREVAYKFINKKNSVLKTGGKEYAKMYLSFTTGLLNLSSVNICEKVLFEEEGYLSEFSSTFINHVVVYP